MSPPASILVVDDEPRWLEALGHVLTSVGYEVRSVSGGESALATVADRLPDAILLDIRMPGMGGFEVLRKLKEREETRDIPVLLLSAFAEVEERVEGLRLGAVDSITKPYHAGELLARVRMPIEVSRLRKLHASQTADLKMANEELGREIALRQRAEALLQTRLLALTLPVDSVEEIRLSDLINVEELQQLQDHFSNATGVASIITQPDGTPITEPSNFCRLCSEVIRKTEAGLRNCYQSDAALGVPCSTGPIVQPCLSGGLWDAGASITVGGKHIANWLIGQVRNEEQNEDQMLRYADEIGADREEFRAALAEVPVMSKARLEQTAGALFTFAREISSRAYQNVQQARFIAQRQQAEDALRESETSIALTLQSIGDAVIATDALGRVTRMNPVAERLTGWSFGEAEGRAMAEVFRIVNAGTRQPVADPVAQVIERGIVVGLANHTVLLSRDGREYQISDSAAPIRDKKGEILGVVLIFSDITASYEAREALRRSEEDYRMLFEGMLEGFALHEIICDDSGRPSDYRFLSINPAFAKITGIRAADAIGKTVRELLPEVEPVWIERYGRVALTGEPVQFEEHNAPLGKDFHITAYRPQPGRFAVVFEDITARKASEARIARLSRFYSALSQCNQSIVHSSSTDELLPKICRDVVDFGGLKMAWVGLVDDAGGRVCCGACYGEGTDYLDGVRIVMDAGDPTGRGPTATAIRENRPVWCQDFQNDPMTAPWHELGARYGWRSVASLPLHLAGATTGAFVMYSDKPNAFEEDVRHLLQEMVNEVDFALESFAREEHRRRAEVALRESEERFRLMLQHMSSVSVQGYYMDGTTHYWNDASEVLYGYTAQEAIGKSLLDLIIPPEMGDGVREAVRSMGETLVPAPPSELTLMRKDGSRVTVYSSHAVIRRQGQNPEFFCIDVDLTDRKVAEEALKKLNSYLEAATVRAEELAVKAESAARAKSDFLALMSHELRTPLNGVLGFAELLSGTIQDEEQQEYTKTILDSGNHLLDVVNDILDFSSIEKGRMQIESAPVVLAALLDASCRTVRKAAADKGLEFRCVMAEDIPAEIVGDSRRIRQILINLLGNAVKFTQQGSVVLMVSRVSGEGSPALEFSVEDSGPGIAAETLGQLFKPFTQADSTVSRQFEGTGLGLAISRRLAEAMGGTLGVESTPGLGSKFTFRLPLENPQPSLPDDVTETPPATAEGGLSRAEGSPNPPEGSLILVVEDDAANRMLAGRMIEHLGFRVEFATNGQEAVGAFSPGKYAAILMDMQMPVMDGMEATRRIREIESGNRTPIIALTANVMPGDREICLEGGMDEFLTKPFKLGDLERMLARFLQP
jgi:PAS domain S-box-containing protein